MSPGIAVHVCRNPVFPEMPPKSENSGIFLIYFNRYQIIGKIAQSQKILL